MCIRDRINTGAEPNSTVRGLAPIVASPMISPSPSTVKTMFSFARRRTFPPVSYTHLDVYKRQVSVCPSVVYMTVDRHIFIQSPTGGAMVYHNIPHCIPSYRIITESYVPVSYTHLLWPLFMEDGVWGHVQEHLSAS